MEPWHCDDRATIYHGDCREVLRSLPDASVDSVVTDPPYELGFMGKRWDASGIAYDAGLWAEALRVLKPGGHLLAFGGTRTWHRLAVAVEDAGFEVRDSIAWLYGSGFPKSLDVSKAIDKAAGLERKVVGIAVYGDGHTQNSAQSIGYGGSDPAADMRTLTAPATPDAARWSGWGTALKPAFEPVVVARKPLTGTVAANVLEYGVGGLNIDGCRIGFASEELETQRRSREAWAKSRRDGKTGEPGAGSYLAVAVSGDSRTGHEPVVVPPGRWPGNVVLDEDQADALDKQSGVTRSTTGLTPALGRSGGILGQAKPRPDAGNPMGYADSGGASRFFYVAKAPARERPKVDGIAHPTVKPLTLMRWLCRLVTPPGGTVLEPFAGSGTTIEAALMEGFHVVAIEREDDYLPLIAARLERVAQEPDGQLTFDASA
jgi:site-specific DNA-methyltransferase (adenine-specific)